MLADSQLLVYGLFWGSSIGMDINFSIMPYGQRWRQHKRAFWQYFHPGALPTYLPLQRKTAHRFLNKLLDTPSRLREHIRL